MVAWRVKERKICIELTLAVSLLGARRPPSFSLSLQRASLPGGSRCVGGCPMLIWDWGAHFAGAVKADCFDSTSAFMRGRTRELGRKFTSVHHAICMTKGGDCDFKKHFMRLERGRSWNLVDYVWFVEH
jgi:hypothetical protein